MEAEGTWVGLPSPEAEEAARKARLGQGQNGSTPQTDFSQNRFSQNEFAEPWMPGQADPDADIWADRISIYRPLADYIYDKVPGMKGRNPNVSPHPQGQPGKGPVPGGEIALSSDAMQFAGARPERRVQTDQERYERNNQDEVRAGRQYKRLAREVRAKHGLGHDEAPTITSRGYVLDKSSADLKADRRVLEERRKKLDNERHRWIKDLKWAEGKLEESKKAADAARFFDEVRNGVQDVYEPQISSGFNGLKAYLAKMGDDLAEDLIGGVLDAIARRRLNQKLREQEKAQRKVDIIAQELRRIVKHCRSVAWDLVAVYEELSDRYR